MTVASNPVDEALVGDLHQVIQRSPLLWEAYIGLPQNQRDAVDAKWLQLIWDTMMAAVTGAEDDGMIPEKPLMTILEDKDVKQS